MRIVRTTLTAGLVACALGACATTSHPEIKDEWVARVPPEKMGPIENERANVQMLEDEAVRAEVAVGDAKRQLDVANAELKVANAKVSAAEAALKAASATGDPAEMGVARNQRAEAEAAKELAQQKVAVAQAETAAAEARVKVARLKLERGRLELDRMKYLVLKDMGDTRIGDINAADFEKALKDVAEREVNAEAELQRRQNRVATAREDLNKLETRSAGSK